MDGWMDGWRGFCSRENCIWWSCLNMWLWHKHVALSGRYSVLMFHEKTAENKQRPLIIYWDTALDNCPINMLFEIFFWQDQLDFWTRMITLSKTWQYLQIAWMMKHFLLWRQNTDLETTGAWIFRHLVNLTFQRYCVAHNYGKVKLYPDASVCNSLTSSYHRWPWKVPKSTSVVLQFIILHFGFLKSDVFTIQLQDYFVNWRVFKYSSIQFGLNAVGCKASWPQIEIWHFFFTESCLHHTVLKCMTSIVLCMPTLNLLSLSELEMVSNVVEGNQYSSIILEISFIQMVMANH